MIVNLRFIGAYSPPTPTSVNLNFGALVIPGDVEDINISFTLGIPGVSLSASVLYASNLGVGVASNFGQGWDVGVGLGNGRGVSWDYANNYKTNDDLEWESGFKLSVKTGDKYQPAANLKAAKSESWSMTSWLRSRDKIVSYTKLDTNKANKDLPWELGRQVTDHSDDRFVQLKPFHKAKIVPWVLTKKLDRFVSHVYDRMAKRLFDLREIPWNLTRYPPTGREVDSVVVIPPFEPYVPSTDINFICVCNYVDPLRVYINFGVDPCPGRGIVVPSRRVYIIMNDITLIRVSDNAEIGVYSASVGTDMSSWCWSFTATIVADDLDLVEPSSGPVEVELTINGIAWRFIIEEYSESKSFGRRGVDISGRSLTALLENPYAPVRSYSQLTTLTSRQLADNELARPNIATGFSLVWSLVDELGWSLPPNSWSYDNLTPIQAIQAIAQGAGGFVNSHRVNKELIVAPEYPWASWELGTATLNKSIPKSLIKVQNIRWQEKPLYNGVYVTGQNTGVTALVKRTGTDGAFQAPIFMSPMITTSAAARSKGISILSSGGMQADVSLSLPFHPDVGVLLPGMVVEITNGGFGSESAWRAFVRSTSIQAARQQGGLTIEQQIQLERHYGGL